MALWQLTVWKRVPTALIPSGFYYWSSTYYVDRGDFTSDGAAMNAGRVNSKVLSLQIVEHTFVEAQSPPGSNSVVARANLFHENGSLTTGTSGYSLTNVAHWAYVGADGTQAWRFLRSPLRYVDLDGQHLSNAYWLLVMGQMFNFVTPQHLRLRNGSLIVGIDCKTEVRMWQMRHGTKRRERQYNF